MAAGSVSVANNRDRRAHWKTLGFAAAGAGFGSLIFSGLVEAFKEETLFHFGFVLVILVIASLVFFERLTELIPGRHGGESAEKSSDRTHLLVWSVGIALLVVVLHRSLETALRHDAEAVGQLLAGGFLASRVTAAWLRGAPSHHAARKGAKSGALVGSIFGVLTLILFLLGGVLPGMDAASPPGVPELAYRIALGLIVGLWIPLLWGAFGFVGGLAIDKHWGSSPTRGILMALSLLAFALAYGLFAYSYFAGHAWNTEALRIIFIAIGWGVGLILHADVCERTLDVPATDPASVITATFAVLPPKTKPHWQGLLAAGLALTLLLLWHQSITIRFFESDNAPPPATGRKYQTQFATSATRFINFELDIPKRLLPSNEFEIDELWAGPLGSFHKTVVGKTEEQTIDRAGWNIPGGWRPGIYTVDLRLNKTRGEQSPADQILLAKGTFEIVGIEVPAPFQPPPEHPIASDTQPFSPAEAPQKPPLVPAILRPDTPHVQHSRAPLPRPPKPLPMEVLMQNARTALAKGHLVSPENDSALYWVRRAKQVSPQDVAAIQIEQTILAECVQMVQRQRKARNYDAALSRLAALQSLYPNRPDLNQLRATIRNEQHRQQYQNPRR